MERDATSMEMTNEARTPPRRLLCVLRPKLIDNQQQQKTSNRRIISAGLARFTKEDSIHGTTKDPSWCQNDRRKKEGGGADVPEGWRRRPRPSPPPPPPTPPSHPPSHLPSPTINVSGIDCFRTSSLRPGGECKPPPPVPGCRPGPAIFCPWDAGLFRVV